MSLFDEELGGGRTWSRVGDSYEVTKKRRGLGHNVYPRTPFASMDSIPQDGAYLPTFTMKEPEAITSGTYFERGDVLVSRITPSFENGKQALITDLPTDFGYATTEVIPLHPRSPEHDPRLLFFYLLHPDVRHFVAERMEGSTGRQRVPEAVLLDVPIPALEFSDEVRVADVLELVKQASALTRACERSTHMLKRGTMEVLFTRGLRGAAQKDTEVGQVPENWDVVRLGSLGRVGNGSTPKRGIPEYWSGGRFPWLTSAKVYARDIIEADQFVTSLALQECHLPIIEPGAILIAITGQGKTLGHCAVLRTRATVSQHVAYVATDLMRANPSFIRGYLETQYDYLRQVGSGGGSTKGALTCAFLRSVPIPLPPTVEEQDEIVEVLDTLDRKAELLRRKHALLDDLFKTLLHKLMTGEIRVADLDLSALEMRQRAESAA